MTDHQSDEADPQHPWPVRGIRTVLDGLNDAVAVCDGSGMIRHANPAAAQLLGWSPGDLDGRPVGICLPEHIARHLAEDFETRVEAVATKRAGRPVVLSLRHEDGHEVPTDVVLSILEHPWADRAIVAVIRPRRDRRIERLGRLSGELVEILAAAPANETPAERLLSTLGHRLRWDVATLWMRSPTGTLACRHVWVREPEVASAFVEEKAKDPTSGSGGMPRWVIDHGDPLWVPDLADNEQFATEAVHRDGLQSAYAFPIRYRGTNVGVVKLLSRRRREPDPGLVELMAVVSGQLGEILNAAGLASERERLVAELEEVRRTQEFLLLASRVLSEATDYRQTVERLAQVAVPVLADLCLIDVRTDDGDLERMAAWHADPSKRALTEQLRVRFPPDVGGAHPSADVMRSGRSRWAAEMSDEFLRATSRNAEHLSILRALEFTSYMTVPLMVGPRVLGTVTLVSAGSGRRFGSTDLTAAEELASQVASVVEHARVLDREREVSHQLQRNLLPSSIPTVEGWAFSTRYVPAAQGVEVGGDWFDVVPVGGGSIALVVGDVEGHDMEAARVMGRLRHVLSLLLVEERSAALALARLNRYLLGSDLGRIATVVVGILDEKSGSVGFASAGHSFGLIVGRDGVRDVGIRPSPPLGVPGGHFDEHRVLLGDDCLLLFTDGLIEHPGEHLDDSLAVLHKVAGSAPSNEPERLADHLLEAMLQDGQGGDDVALLAVKRRTGSS